MLVTSETFKTLAHQSAIRKQNLLATEKSTRARTVHEEMMVLYRKVAHLQLHNL